MLMVTERVAAGAIVSALGCLAAIVVGIRHWRTRPPMPLPESDLSRTNLWRPYRTAIAKPTQELYESLANLETQVARVAREEGWEVNWSQHSTAVQAAVEARLEQRFGRGLRDVTRAIDFLMTALYTARRSPRPSAVPVPERGGVA
jgi:hypothetical protein